MYWKQELKNYGPGIGRIPLNELCMCYYCYRAIKPTNCSLIGLLKNISEVRLANCMSQLWNAPHSDPHCASLEVSLNTLIRGINPLRTAMMPPPYSSLTIPHFLPLFLSLLSIPFLRFLSHPPFRLPNNISLSSPISLPYSPHNSLYCHSSHPAPFLIL